MIGADPATGRAVHGRLDWMDGLRGTAIVFVLVLHSTEILRAGGVEVPRWMDVANTVVSPFRMPLLMALSGILLEPALSKGPRRYLTGKLRAIA